VKREAFDFWFKGVELDKDWAFSVWSCKEDKINELIEHNEKLKAEIREIRAKLCGQE
jgi:hypothetical protein